MDCPPQNRDIAERVAAFENVAVQNLGGRFPETHTHALHNVKWKEGFVPRPGFVESVAVERKIGDDNRTKVSLQVRS
jgi:hypothetical protein